MSDARRQWIAQISTYHAQPGNVKQINQQLQQIGGQAKIRGQGPAKRSASTAAIGQLAQAQYQQQNINKLGQPTQPGPIEPTQIEIGGPAYRALPVEEKSTLHLPPAFQKASNLRVQKGEIKPPPPPKESYQKYIDQAEAQNKRRFLQRTKAKYEYEQTLANYRAAITNIGRNVFNSGTAFLDRIPTPGNLRIPFLILFILFFVLVPVNGHTRIGWLWLTFLGDTTISPNTNKYDQSSLGLGSVGTAGGGDRGGVSVKQEQVQSTTGALGQQWQSDTLPTTVATGYSYASLYGGEFE